MTPTTPKPKKTKEELIKALKELQMDPGDLEQVMAGKTCETCYSKYGGALEAAEEEPTK